MSLSWSRCSVSDAEPHPLIFLLIDRHNLRGPGAVRGLDDASRQHLIDHAVCSCLMRQGEAAGVCLYRPCIPSVELVLHQMCQAYFFFCQCKNVLKFHQHPPQAMGAGGGKPGVGNLTHGVPLLLLRLADVVSWLLRGAPFQLWDLLERPVCSSPGLAHSGQLAGSPVPICRGPALLRPTP